MNTTGPFNLEKRHTWGKACLRGCRGGVLVLWLVGVAFLISSCSWSGRVFSSGPGLNPTEKMMWSTYMIGSEKGMGAGFVVFRRDADGVTVPVVVTAAHLLEAIGPGPLFVGARMPDNRGEARAVLIEFMPKQGGQKYYVRHPLHDVAAFELRIPREAAGMVALPSFLDASAHEARPLRAGQEVSFVGFPQTMPEMEGLFPVLRTGRVASYPVGTSQSGGMFVINADVYPGDSGAPVFVVHDGRPELSGMIVRRVSADKKAFSHLAVAVESRLIRETLFLLDKQEVSDRAGRTARNKPAAAPR